MERAQDKVTVFGAGADRSQCAGDPAAAGLHDLLSLLQREIDMVIKQCQGLHFFGAEGQVMRPQQPRKIAA